MPELANRRALERELIAELSVADAQTRYEIAQLLGEEIALEGLPLVEWEAIGERYREAIEGHLRRAFLASVFALALYFGSRRSDITIPVAGNIQNRAAAWASQHSAGLVQGLNETSRRRIQGLIGSHLAGDISKDELIREINRTVYNPSRARLIAETEITRANVEGEREALEEAGVLNNFVAVWITVLDDRTCPICAPLNGTIAGVDWSTYPPVHPGCRCAVEWRAKDGV